MDNTEKYIYKLYKSINIVSHDLLSIDNLSAAFSMEVYYWEFTSAIVQRKDKYKMFINENLSHQEYKADYFAYHFCVPTFMFRKLRELNIYEIMNLFNIEFDFGLRRLELYKNKILMRGVISNG